MICRSVVLFVAFLIFCATCSAAGNSVTFGTLVDEMTDLLRLGDYPEPGFRTVQFSSYDRRSNQPGGPGWFANSDGFGNEPVPNFEAVIDPPDDRGVGRYLICDVEGPGAIVRTWTAAIAGTIRVTLDGSEQPIYEGSAQQFLQESYRTWAEIANVDAELFEGSFRQRDACYLPIPFAQRCRIEWIGKTAEIHFYEVQVRRYEVNANVASFRPQDLQTYSSELKRAAQILSDPQTRWPYRSKLAAEKVDVQIAPGEQVEAIQLKGPKAIERLTLKLAADDLDQALRQTVLQVVFDDHSLPQIQSPLGDFFGASPGVNPFNSAPFTVQGDGRMTCRYVMPFARSCRVMIENCGSQSVQVVGDVLPVEYDWDDDRSMHFRARWRVDHDLVADSGDGAQDITYLSARGQGVYVGTTAMLLNPNPIPTSYGNWWGEGDEKIFIDEDVRPSTFGTGSEDYFNYSWSSPDIFLYPYCGQPRNDGPANRGFVVNYRWHVMDALPFNKQISFAMELFSHERTPGVSYARIGYHYGRPGLYDDHLGPTSESLRSPRLPDGWLPEARMGARDSTFYQAEDILDDGEPRSFTKHPLWAGGQLLEWRPQQVGDQLAFHLPVLEAGKYVIHITAANTPNSGKIAATIGDESVGLFGEGSANLQTEFRTLSRTHSSPPLPLDAGPQRLVLEWQGADGQGETTPTVGLDFIWLQRR